MFMRTRRLKEDNRKEVWGMNIAMKLKLLATEMDALRRSKLERFTNDYIRHEINGLETFSLISY